MVASDYGFLLRLVNTFTIDTDEYYPMCYRVNRMSRPLKTLYIIILRFVLTNHHHIRIGNTMKPGTPEHGTTERGTPAVYPELHRTKVE